MTFRFSALALAALLVVGCGDSGSSDADVDLAGMDDFEMLAYAAGFQSALGVKGDSASFKFFSYDTFAEGFRDGMAQDSAKIAYLYGYELGNRIAGDTLSGLNPDLFLAGFRTGLDRDSMGISDEELQRISGVVQDSLGVRQLRARAKTDPNAAAQLQAMRTNEGAAREFLREVEGRDGVVKTESGLLYSIETAGDGESPQNPTDVVRVNYIGRLPDGTTFDQSGEGGQMFGLAQVAEGFAEGVSGMKVGGKRTLYLPPKIGYGLQGSPQAGIPPNSALIFEVELLDVMTLEEASQPLPGQ